MMIRRILILASIALLATSLLPFALAQAESEDLFTALLGEDARDAFDEAALASLSLRSPQPGETGEYLPPGRDYERTVLIAIWSRRDDQRLEARQADDSSATARLERELDRDPSQVDLRCELGRLYAERGDYAAAYRHFSHLIRERLGDYC